MKPDKETAKRSFFHSSQTFLTFFGLLLLMSGIHQGLIVLGSVKAWSPIVQTIVPLLYWVLVAAGLTEYIRATIKRNYDIPIRNISQAAEKVAKGDFSVQVPSSDDSEMGDYLKILAENFNKMVAELANVETLRTDFIANVSHELKTPLAVMQSYGTLLQQPNLTEEKRLEYAKTITDSSRRLADMITNILKLNKLENQTLYSNTQNYDLSEQLCTCLLGFEDIWEKKGLDIQADIPENVQINADPELLSLVWNNLFSNAIKFTEPGGSVSVSLKAEGAFAVVSVTDTGCGISPETGKHIFEKFYQGDTSHAASGNGLGLALVKRVIDIVQGDIRVRSEVGKGSTFTVKLRRQIRGTD